MVYQTLDPAKSLNNHCFFQQFGTFNMLQVTVKFNQNLNPLWHQNQPKFHQKSFKKAHQIESWFRKHMFFDFCSLPAWFWINFGSKMVGVLLSKAASKALPSPNWTSKAIWASLGTILEAIWNYFWHP